MEISDAVCLFILVHDGRPWRCRITGSFDPENGSSDCISHAEIAENAETDCMNEDYCELSV